MKKINFYYDSKQLNRNWFLNLDKSPKSGTEYAISNLAIYLSNFYKVNFFCTKLPSDIIHKNIKFKKLKAFTNIDTHIEQGEYLISNYSQEKLYLKEISSKKKKNIKHIVWLHNTPPFELLIKLEDNVNIYKLITVSDTQRINLSYVKIFKKIITIPHIIDFKFDIKKKYKVEKQILFIGSLTKSKGFHMLAKLWPSIYSKFPNWKLKVLGSTNLYSNFNMKQNPEISKYESNFLKDIGGSYVKAKKNGVIFKGSVSRKKVFFEILKSKIIVVNPNIHGSFETFCISASQGLLLGKPILGSIKGSLPEVINEGGLLHSSEAELKNNLVKLISDKNLRLSLGRYGKKNYKKNFKIHTIQKKWIDLLSNKKINNYYQKKIYLNNISEFFIKSLIRIFFSNNLILFLKKTLKKLMTVLNQIL